MNKCSSRRSGLKESVVNKMNWPRAFARSQIGRRATSDYAEVDSGSEHADKDGRG